MIDRVHWINKEKLVQFIIDCQVWMGYSVDSDCTCWELWAVSPVFYFCMFVWMLLSFSEMLYFVENLRIRKMGVYLIDRTMPWMSTILTLGWLVTKCCLTAFWASHFPFLTYAYGMCWIFELFVMLIWFSFFWSVLNFEMNHHFMFPLIHSLRTNRTCLKMGDLYG